MDEKEKETLLELFDDMYNLFYENPEETIEFKQETLTTIGDALIKLDTRFFTEFSKARGDLIASDRETASYAVTYLMHLVMREGYELKRKGENK